MIDIILSIIARVIFFLLFLQAYKMIAVLKQQTSDINDLETFISETKERILNLKETVPPLEGYADAINALYEYDKNEYSFI